MTLVTGRTGASPMRAGGTLPAGAVSAGRSWATARRELEAMASQQLAGGRRARVRAAFPFGAGGATVLFDSGSAEELARGEGDPHRPAAVLEPAPAGAATADFRVRVLFPEGDPELPRLGGLLAGGGGLPLPGRPLRAVLRAYRPLRRAVVELETEGGAIWFVKLERPRRAQAAAARNEALAGLLSGPLRAPAAGPADAAAGMTLAAAGMTLAAAAPGTSLTAWLAGPEAVPALRQVGRALGELERAFEAAPELARVLPSHGYAGTLADLERFAALLGRLALPEAAAIAAGLARLGALAPDSGRRAVLHRDLHDRQVLVGEHTTLLDLDQASIGDPALDLGNLLAHLRLRALQARTSESCARLRNALLGGYGAPWAGAWREAVLAWEAATLFRLAAVYALRPRWSHLGSELARQAHGLLSFLGVDAMDRP